MCCALARLSGCVSSRMMLKFSFFFSFFRCNIERPWQTREIERVIVVEGSSRSARESADGRAFGSVREEGRELAGAPSERGLRQQEVPGPSDSVQFARGADCATAALLRVPRTLSAGTLRLVAPSIFFDNVCSSSASAATPASAALAASFPVDGVQRCG